MDTIDIKTTEEADTNDTTTQSMGDVFVAEKLTEDNNENDILTQMIKDEYGREILEPTFENILTMSKNTLKRNYSKIKNTIFQYKSLSSEFIYDTELFTRGKDKLFLAKPNGEQLLLYCSLPEGSLDKKVYPHRTLKNKAFKDYPILLTVRTPVSVKRATEIIDLVMHTKAILKANVAVPKAYAEMYPIKVNAVIKGSESLPPDENKLKDEQYKDVYAEISSNITEEKVGKPPKKPLKGGEKLATQRQTAKTVKAAIALAEPIVYFYDVAVDKENNDSFINIQQVLNDKFLGKLVPQYFFAVAEGSDRIEKLNFLALERAVVDCNLKQDKNFALNISCRLLMKQANVNKLLKMSKTEKENLILSFDCALLEALGEKGMKGIIALKDAGIKIMLDNTEQAGMKALTEYFVDYLRFDARYYAESTPKTLCHLDMMTGYAKVQGITTIAMYVENIKQAISMITHGVDCIEGSVVSNPRRLFNVAIKEKKRLPVSGG